MLKAGDKAPSFVLRDENDEDVSLASLLEAGPLILYFYPADFTPGCTKEACSIRDIHDDIVSVGLRVAGVSPQDPESHAQFRDRHALPFTLLCDPDKAVARKFGVNGMFGIGVRRATFLINQDRTIEDAVIADIMIGAHRSFIENAVSLREAGAKRGAKKR